MTIEWNENKICYESDAYKEIISVGLLGGIMVAKYDHNTGWLWCDYGSINTKHDTLEEAKAKAEQLFKEWKEAAGLVSRSDITSCDKCGNSGVTKGCPKCGHDRITVFKGDLDYCLNCRETFPCGGSTKPCDCLKDSHNLASINRAVKEEGR
jgi:hypothetical protein